MFTMKMSEEEHAAMKAAADAAGVSMADLVRSALASWAAQGVPKVKRAPVRSRAEAVLLAPEHVHVRKNMGWGVICDICKVRLS